MQLLPLCKAPLQYQYSLVLLRCFCCWCREAFLMDCVAEIIVVGVILPYSKALVNEVCIYQTATQHATLYFTWQSAVKWNPIVIAFYRQQTALNVFFPFVIQFNQTCRLQQGQIQRKVSRWIKIKLSYRTNRISGRQRGGAAVTRCVIAIKESLGFNYTDMGCLFHLTAVGHWQRRPLELRIHVI